MQYLNFIFSHLNIFEQAVSKMPVVGRDISKSWALQVLSFTMIIFDKTMEFK